MVLSPTITVVPAPTTAASRANRPATTSREARTMVLENRSHSQPPTGRASTETTTKPAIRREASPFSIPKLLTR